MASEKKTNKKRSPVEKREPAKRYLPYTDNINEKKNQQQIFSF